MPQMETLDHEHQMILEEVQLHRLAAERRHAVPGCAWGCDGFGWRVIVFSEYGPLDAIAEVDPAVIVLPWGLLLFPCECNSIAGGGVRRGLGWASGGIE